MTSIKYLHTHTTKMETFSILKTIKSDFPDLRVRERERDRERERIFDSFFSFDIEHYYLERVI